MLITVWDDDPKHGRPGLVTYEVQNVTGPHATHYLSDGSAWRQKRHPLDGLRDSGQGEAAGPSRPRKKCETVGCVNLAGEHHRDCSTCRSKRLQKCACGNRMSYGSRQCKACAFAARRGHKRMFFPSDRVTA